MEVLHAVFHGALVGADLVVAALIQGPAAGVHALADLVVLDAGLHVGGLLRLHEFGLEGRDLFGVVELDHVQRPVHRQRVQGRDREHVRIPLHHDVGVVGQPDRAAFGQLAVAVGQQHVVPLPVGVRAGLGKAGCHAHGLHRVLLGKLPLQVVAGHEVAQARVEGADVVVLEVDLDEGLPVVVALVHLDMVEHEALEAQLLAQLHAGQVGLDVAAVVLEQQAVPLAQPVVVQVQAGIVAEVRCAQQLAAGAVGPAVQRADDVAPRMALAFGHQIAPALEHHGLAVAADVGDQLHLPPGIAHQSAAFLFLGQGVVVAYLGNGQLVAHVARAALKDGLQLALEQRRVEVTGNW